MFVSTRGRYALRVLVDIAEQNRAGNSGYIPLKDISARQEISRKYLESIMTQLSKNGFVEGVHGKGGGYKLNRPPEEYKVGEILRLTEGTLAPVACLQSDAQDCARAKNCRTLPLWSALDKLIADYLDGVSIADLMKAEQ